MLKGLVKKHKGMGFDNPVACPSRRACLHTLAGAGLAAAASVPAAARLWGRETNARDFGATVGSITREASQGVPDATLPQEATGEGPHWARQPIVPNKVRGMIQPLDYSSQQMHPESLLGRRLEINLNRGLLGAIELDSYLRPYREGTRPVWPAGEYLGKFMQAFSRMYLYSGKSELLDKMRLVTRTWITAQDRDGWVGTGGRWGAWDVWEHKYTLLGLLEQYALTGDQSSLDAAKKIGDLLAGGFGPGRRDLMRTGSWAMGSGSVLEPMVYLYRFTGEMKYLQFCFEIIRELEGSAGPKLIEILGRGSGSVYDVVDPLSHWHNGRKGYEMLSCLIGLLRMYQLTGRVEYLLPATRGWRDIVDNRLFITGTTTNSETFRPAGVLPGESADDVGEGCVSAHWLYLNRILLHITGDMRYADEIEKTLYNHLIASSCPTNAHQAYFAPINGTRPFELQNIWGGQPPCCLSSVMRCIARTPESVWGRLSDGGFALVLYSGGKASTVVETSEGPSLVTFEVETDFPSSENIRVRVNPRQPCGFRLALRVPGWTRQFTAMADGKTWTGIPGKFLMVSKRWKPGDEVSISIDLNDRLARGGPTYDGYFAFKRGPQVLALDGRLGFAALGEVRVDPKRPLRLSAVPSVLPSGWIGSQAYKSGNLDAEGRAILVPFSDTGQEGVSHTYRTWIRARRNE